MEKLTWRVMQLVEKDYGIIFNIAIGLNALPLYLTVMWRCSPVLRPLEPVMPMEKPARMD